MNFQQPRKIKPPRTAILVIIFTIVFTFCTLYYSPSIQYFQKKSSQTTTSIEQLQDSIRTTESLQQSTTSHQEKLNDNVEVENSSSSSSRKHKKSMKENVDDGEVLNSSSQQDKKSMEENVVIEQYTSSNWPDVTADELFKNDVKESRPNNNKERDRQSKQNKPRKRGRMKKGNRKKQDQEPPPPPPPPPPPSEPEKTPISQEFIDSLVSSVEDRGGCDLFSGEWVHNSEAPYYTNRTCIHIQEHQNCMKFGKPDKGYMQWKWKPDNECELPLFDPNQFLELLRGKSLAFVGDSVARNHMQSLICLLSRVVLPIDISNNKDENFKRFEFSDYNFTISIFWAPYLVRTERTDPNDVTQPFKLYLDEFDENWRTQVESYDYIILSAGQWFFRPTMFYLNETLVGCLYCSDKNVTHLSSHFSYRRAFKTAFSAINSLKNFKGVTFLRTFATSHFEGGPWDKGGDCVRTKPFNRTEMAMEDYSLEIYKIQLQELKTAQKAGGKRGYKFRLFDATRPMFLRPDGHPSKYGHWPKANVSLANDCVHWCLPGPIDTLNDFLQELIIREFERSSQLLQ